MLTEKASNPDIASSFNGHEGGLKDDRAWKTVLHSLRSRSHARRDGLGRSLLVKFGVVVASLTFAFLLVQCARAFSALRVFGSQTRLLAGGSFLYPVIGCGPESSFVYDFDGDRSANSGARTGALLDLTAFLSGYSGGVSVASEEVTWDPSPEPPVNVPPIADPGPGGLWLVATPPPEPEPSGPFYGVPVGEPLKSGYAEGSGSNNTRPPSDTLSNGILLHGAASSVGTPSPLQGATGDAQRRGSPKLGPFGVVAGGYVQSPLLGQPPSNTPRGSRSSPLTGGQEGIIRCIHSVSSQRRTGSDVTGASCCEDTDRCYNSVPCTCGGYEVRLVRRMWEALWIKGCTA
ncbi:LOW QUALITY PROTEIN: uncharacterized protein EMH_0058270 [Eimeria mitis]|uniref:Transmembrane protein n=1 Tax=Eimeria mitis TaxID=44415 RepID=U6K2A8_9EIME|nr:LOW QUALITY PROTEIN: uncharacterized protein EMH_0058270 [Eimeria mitis]CDJ30452.1 hypothetical protein, conserved [Eimeria mitis]